MAATNLRDSVDERYGGGNGNLAEGEGRLAESVSAPPAHLHKQMLFYYTMEKYPSEHLQIEKFTLDLGLGK